MDKPPRILLVEDDPLIAADIKWTLGRIGCEITAVIESGESAIQYVCDNSLDMVLMDVKLAGVMDGIKAAEQIRKTHDLPIIYLTAHSDNPLLERAKLTEPFGYLLKPFQPKELQIAVEMALYKHRLDNELRETNYRLEHEISERKRSEEELRRSRGQFRKLSARLEELEEIERRRLARELHDQVGQNLTTLSIHANILRSQLSPESLEKVGDRLNDTQTLLEETTEVIRNVMADLRPAVLDDYGLLAALRWYGDLFMKRTGIPVTVQGEDSVPRFSMPVETALFRIVQEALTNIVKHAESHQIHLSLDIDAGPWILTIIDDGKGFDVTRLSGSGYGLLGMRERAISVGGHLDIESSPGKGTKIIVEFI